jgi:hypothetical protein
MLDNHAQRGSDDLGQLLESARSGRNARLRQIVELIREKPRTIAKLVEETRIPRSTSHEYARILIEMGVAKKLGDGRLAWIDYVFLTEQLEALIKDNVESDYERNEWGSKPPEEVIQWDSNLPEKLAFEVGLSSENREFREAYPRAFLKVRREWQKGKWTPKASYRRRKLGLA